MAEGVKEGRQVQGRESGLSRFRARFRARARIRAHAGPTPFPTGLRRCPATVPGTGTGSSIGTRPGAGGCGLSPGAGVESEADRARKRARKRKRRRVESGTGTLRLAAPLRRSLRAGSSGAEAEASSGSSPVESARIGGQPWAHGTCAAATMRRSCSHRRSTGSGGSASPRWSDGARWCCGARATTAATATSGPSARALTSSTSPGWSCRTRCSSCGPRKKPTSCFCRPATRMSSAGPVPSSDPARRPPSCSASTRCCPGIRTRWCWMPAAGRCRASRGD